MISCTKVALVIFILLMKSLLSYLISQMRRWVNMCGIGQRFEFSDYTKRIVWSQLCIFCCLLCHSFDVFLFKNCFIVLCSFFVFNVFVGSKCVWHVFNRPLTAYLHVLTQQIESLQQSRATNTRQKPKLYNKPTRNRSSGYWALVSDWERECESCEMATRLVAEQHGRYMTVGITRHGRNVRPGKRRIRRKCH